MLSSYNHKKYKIQELVEIQAKIRKAKPAIILYSKKLIYEELHSKSNQFANFLIDHQVRPGDIIPIVSSKSPELFIIILGILKAGAAYSPLNTDNPSKHIETIVKETKAKYVCVESSLIDRFKFSDDTTVIKVDDIETHIKHYNEKNIDENLTTKSDLAYVIYTSGTTGAPKGCMIAHANLLPTYSSWKEAYQLSDTDIHLQMAPIGFDVFSGDWIRALCSGATLVLCPKNILIEPEKLYNLIVQEKITCAEFVPAILRQLINFVKKNNYNLQQFRLLVCGSDQWTMGEYRSVKKLCDKKSRVISSYGLTETTIDSTFYEEDSKSISLDDKSVVPIGKPFKHVTLYLVNDDKLATHSEAGEIYIGGPGVGLGYLNQIKLTSDKFVIKYSKNNICEKIYKTGDQGVKLSDGNFLFLGRNKGHIKIHGKRVDLPSLESVINQYQKIKFGIVSPSFNTESHNVILKCFFTLNDDSLTFDEIVNYIKSELPCYYVPKEFYHVETIPLSLNGKIDRRISSQKIIKELKPEIHPPYNKTQEYLINLWKEILGAQELGIKNDFYDLGGSSFLYVNMLEKINKKFNIAILSTIKLDTIETLANYIEQKRALPIKYNKIPSEIYNKPVKSPVIAHFLQNQKSLILPKIPNKLLSYSLFQPFSQKFLSASRLTKTTKTLLSLVLRK